MKGFTPSSEAGQPSAGQIGVARRFATRPVGCVNKTELCAVASAALMAGKRDRALEL
jgi:hypothetical protein